MVEDVHTIWRIWGDGGLIDKLGPDRTIRELKKRCDAGAIIGCSLYKLLIEKWIDVATGAKDPGQRGPAEDFMSSAGEDELVKKIEDLHVQYPNGIPRSIRIDVKDEWNAELEAKVGRRIPLDPKDASKKDIAESKKIAEQLAAGVGLPRPAKPKVGVEELPLPPPVKPAERAPPRAAPELVPTPITTRALPELDLMKKEIKERIEEEKRRRLKEGPIAGEQKEHYRSGKDIAAGYVDVYSRWTYDDFKIIINRTTDIGILADLGKHIDESTATPLEKSGLRKIIAQREAEIRRGGPEIRKQAEKLEAEGRVVKIERQSPELREREDDVMQVPEDYTEWEFGDFEGQIPGLDDPEDLEEMLEYTDATDKLTKDEAKTLREMIKERIKKVEKTGS